MSNKSNYVPFSLKFRKPLRSDNQTTNAQYLENKQIIERDFSAMSTISSTNTSSSPNSDADADDSTFDEV